MKMFMWRNTVPVSDSFHSNGGLCIVAEDLESARDLWENSREASPIYGTLLDPMEAVRGYPDAVYALEGVYEPAIYVFPNAGCCDG